jgi:UDP-galactopyranose mutase
MKKKVAIIIGGGVAGCTSAFELNKLGYETIIVEKGEYLGAGVRTFWFGGHPYTFGPRHFLTHNDEVYNYMDAICPLRLCSEHEFITYVEQDDAFYNYPIHEDDIKMMPDRVKIENERLLCRGVENAKDLETYWIQSVGNTLYSKMIKKYNHKMWLTDDNTKINTFNWSPKGATIKSGPRAAWNLAKSAYPYAEDGYNKYFDVTTKDSKVLLNTTVERYDLGRKYVIINGEIIKFDFLINTISPDEMFGKCFGELRYIGRDFHKIVIPNEFVFPENVYFTYYANDEKFTRLVEYKKFTHHKSKNSLIGMEIPSLNGKHYPLPYLEDQYLASRYFSEMPEYVFSLGRAGSYRYGLDIDDCIEQALDLVKLIKEGTRTHPVPLIKWQE